MKKSLILVGMLAIGYANAQTENYEGRVGVNTETPSATLNVKSKTGTDASTKALEVENANGTKMVTILDNGRVGIGTDAPEYALDVQTSGSHPDRLKDYAYGSMRLLRYRDAGSMGLDFYRARGTKEAPLAVQKGDGLGNIAVYGYLGDKFVTAGSIGFSVGDTPTSDNVIPMQYDISFRNQASGGSMRNGYNSVFRINSVGNVGISVLEPSERLHVDGNIRATSLAGTGERIVVADSDGVLKTGDITNNLSKWTNDTTDSVVKLTNLSNGSTARADDRNIFITDTGRIGVGIKTPWSAITVDGESYGKSSILIRRMSLTPGAAPTLQLERYRKEGEELKPLILHDMLGAITYTGYDGDNFVVGGSLQMRIDGDVSQGKLPTRFDFQTRTDEETAPSVKMRLDKNGNLGIGVSSNISEKLEVNGKIKASSLAQTGAGDRVVYADENGVLKTGGSIASNNGVQNQSAMTCTAENAGKINYTTIQKDGKDTGVFGFCMQKGTEYVWAYMLGGSNIYGTSANGAAFGSGL